jgi:hypothetical protein
VVASVTSFASCCNTPPISNPRHGTVSGDPCSKHPAVCARLGSCWYVLELLARALAAWSAALNDSCLCNSDASSVALCRYSDILLVCVAVGPRLT